jgi:hypothetical protein
MHGKNLCDMDADELEIFLDKIAQRGGKRGAEDALSAVGLGDKDAGRDVGDLRDLMKGYRLVKTNLWSTAISGASKIAGWALIIWLVSMIVGHSPEAKGIAKLLGE